MSIRDDDERAELYRKAIDGTLVSTTTHESVAELFINNTFALPLAIYLISDQGWWIGGVERIFTEPGYPAVTLPGNASTTLYSAQGFDLGWYLIFLNAQTGAFVTVLQVDYINTGPLSYLQIDPTLLLAPNAIGPVPQPNASVLIPPDSPRIVVGCGNLQAPQGGKPRFVVREQYWQRLPQSYSIAAGAKRNTQYTVTSGMESTTSEQSVLAASVTGSATAGWGPISATLSTSLSKTSASFQQTSTNFETSSFVSQTYDNTKGETPKIFYYWQLTNVVTVFEQDGPALSSLIYGSESPAVIDAHDVASLPVRPLRKELPMSAEMRALLSAAGTTAPETEAATPRSTP